MTVTEQDILLYPDLSQNEREAVDRYVAAHPHLRALLDEAKALTSLMDQLPAADGAPDAQDIARYILSRHLDTQAPPDEHVQQYAIIERALAENPALERQARVLATNLERLAADAEDPVLQFERLTGRRLEPIPKATEVNAPTFRLYRLRPLRLALAASLAAVVLYGALAIANYVATPGHVQMAALDGVTQVNAGMTLRGAGPTDRTLERYAAALDQIESARTSVLGLFVTYDDTQLDQAAADLRSVIDESEEGSWEALEALYVLGKIRVHQNRTDDALWALQAVVSMDGPHASDARRLIDYLQTKAP